MSNISLFIPAFSKSPSEEISITDFLQGVKFGKWQKEVEAVRNEPDTDKRKILKQNVPGVTISGTFTERKEINLIQHSGFICMDIDGHTNKESLLSDPYTYACLLSISNGGLAVIVKIDKSKHKESFRWIQEYYFKSYGIPVDPAPSNPASLRFVSFDPLCYTNPKSKTAKFNSPRQKKLHSLPVFFPQDKAAEMVKECVALGKNIAESYQEYLTLGFSIAAGFGEAGRQYFHALAGLSNKYNSVHADRQYNFCLRNPSGGVTVGSFYYMLNQAGIAIPRNDVYESAVRISAIQKKEGGTKESTINTLTSDYNIPKDDAVRIADEVHKRPDITLNSIASDPDQLIQSVVAWMHMKHPIKKNLVTRKLENSEGELVKEKFNTIYLHARAAFNTPNITPDLIERILFSDFTPSYNPLKQYIESNRHRNTTGNIDRLIASVKSPTEGYELFIRKWLLAIPAAIEGRPIRIVLSFSGVQLSGKTEWFRRLLPSSLKKYYGESKLMQGKDDELLMCEKLIVCDDEMGGKSRSDELYFKMISSKDYFSLRESYGRSNMDYKRLALLCGTSNDKVIINDPTGNTRILPVEVTSIDHEMYNSVDKDELFMEIVREYESGNDWNFTKDEVKTLEITSKEFEGIKIEQELILRYFLPKEEADGNGFIEEMTATEIKSYIEVRSFQKIMNMRVFGMELKSIFGDSIRKKIGGKIMRKYSVVKLQENNNLSNPINNQQNLPKIEDEPF